MLAWWPPERGGWIAEAPVSSRRWLWWWAATALLVTAVAGGRRWRDAGHDVWATAGPELQTVLWPAPRPLAPFRMRTQHGAVYTSEQMRGQWNFVFFGYLQCPDVCPTTLQTLHAFRQLLLAADPAAARDRFIFVSVDPGHDNPKRMAVYLAHFDPQFIGLTGVPDQLAALAGPLGVAYAEHVDASGMRSMDHSTSILLIDPAGTVVGAFPAPHDPARLLRLFQQLRRHFGG